MIKNNLKKVAVLSLSTIMLFSNIVFASSEIDSLKQQRESLDKKLEVQQSEIRGINNQLNQVVSEIKALDYQISKSQQELDTLTYQIGELEVSIQKNEENLQKAKDKLKEKEDELNTRLREQYKSGDVIFLEVFMGSSSIVEMLTKMDIVESVVTQDKELLDFTNKQIKYIEETEEKLRLQREEYQQKLDSEKAKKIELESANNRKLQYMSTLENDRQVAENQYDNFVNLTTSLDQKIVQLEIELEEQRKAAEEARRRAEEEARRQAEARRQEQQRQAALKSQVPSSYPSSSNGSSSSQVRGSGELIWPVPGSSRISSYYGYRVHPIFNTQKFHAGIDIPAPQGSPIVASDSGIVIYSGWQGGYGNVVMISHGNDVVTVYAHNSANVVSVGDYVDAGQTISLCGSTGYSTGPHLHFEVRKNGSTTDPMNWL